MQWAILLVGWLRPSVVFLVSSGVVSLSVLRAMPAKKSKVVWPNPQRKRNANDPMFLHLWCDGAVSLVDGQDAGMGVVRPDFGLEEVMGMLGMDQSQVGTVGSALGNNLICVGTSFTPIPVWKGGRAQHHRERIIARGMQNPSLVASLCRPKKWLNENGQQKTTERRLFPGYVFVEMVMDDDTWHLVKHKQSHGVLSVGKTALRPFLKKKFRNRQPDARRYRISRATRSNSWWVRLVARQGRARSPTSTVRLKR